jgi:hypothetical protein
VRAEYSITAATGPAMARAATAYRLLRPAFLGAVVLEVLCGVFLLGAGHRGSGIVVLVVAALGPAVLLLQTPRLGRAMQYRGYRPGTTMSIDWEPRSFTLATPDASSTQSYDQVASARAVGRAVVLRMRGSRMLLVVPAELVPGEVRPRFRLGRRP